MRALGGAAAETQPMSSEAIARDPARTGRASRTSASRSRCTCRPAGAACAARMTPSTVAIDARSADDTGRAAFAESTNTIASEGATGTMRRAYGIQSPPAAAIAHACTTHAIESVRAWRDARAIASGANERSGVRTATDAAAA